ncbi:pentatricopeptide (PPR) repeat protein [Medicago truncatula]|uniref:Pentatricopeptide (PPR) repeat protein n=2 Tax=Medicago truncatula TaxID=3880 RepID=G7KKI6_MEDTR|nr:pentatricopeptide (PPR) repeat protein [Medicago truncatula]
MPTWLSSCSCSDEITSNRNSCYVEVGSIGRVSFLIGRRSGYSEAEPRRSDFFYEYENGRKSGVMEIDGSYNRRLFSLRERRKDIFKQRINKIVLPALDTRRPSASCSNFWLDLNRSHHHQQVPPSPLSNAVLRLTVQNCSHFRSIPNGFVVDNAVLSFNRMLQMRHTPSIVEFNKILTYLIKTKNHYPTVLSLSTQMESKGVKPDLFTLSILINCYYFKMGYEPNTITLTTLIKGLCLNGKVNEALLFHDHVLALGFHLNHVTYGILINGLCKMGQTRAALQVLRQIEGKLVNTNVVMYSTVIDGLCKDKLVIDAYGLYSEMIVKRIPPTVVTFKAFSLFHEMVLKNINPNVYTFNILVDALCKDGKIKEAKNVIIKMVDEALNLFTEMHCKPNTVSYNTLIDGFCKSGRLSHAWKLLDQMRDRGQPPNVITYNSLLHALCKNHHVDKAIALVNNFKDQGIQPDMHTYNTLVDGLCKQGRLKDAQLIFQDLLIKGYNLPTWTYNIMINGLCLEGLLDEAETLLSKMEDNGCIPDVVTYQTIIHALFEKDENDKAEKLVRELIVRGLL